ncbi:MAG: hypothetical protein GY795_12205 [Desulfobacterales bacterium]|nr:hypothetical protein [Desulfobacterales bacterium]
MKPQAVSLCRSAALKKKLILPDFVDPVLMRTTTGKMLSFALLTDIMLKAPVVCLKNRINKIR